MRSSPSTASISIAAELSSSVCARRAAAVGSASARLSPRSSSRAISAARSASRRRSSASRVRARVISATELASTATTRNATSATQLLEFWSVKRPTGGRWKKLNAAALSSAVADAEPRAPGDRHDQHRRQVDDAQRRPPARRARADRRSACTARRRPRRRARRRGAAAVLRPAGSQTERHDISLMQRNGERGGSRLPPRSVRPARFGARCAATRCSTGRARCRLTVPAMIIDERRPRVA